MSEQKSSERRMARKMIRSFDKPRNAHVKVVTAQTPSPAKLWSLFTAVTDELLDTGIVAAENENEILEWGNEQVLHEMQHASAARADWRHHTVVPSYAAPSIDRSVARCGYGAGMAGTTHDIGS